MAERKTLARPYAEAVFQMAQERTELKAWGDMLDLAAAISSDEQMKAVLHNPQVGRDAITGLFESVIGLVLVSIIVYPILGFLIQYLYLRYKK